MKIIRMKLLVLLRNWFLTGVLISLPLIITGYIVVLVIDFFDNLVIRSIFPDAVISRIPGLGIIFSCIFMVLLGFIASNFLGKYILKISDRILNKIPLISPLYSTTKQIFDTLLSSKSKAFREVALIEYPRKGMWVLGFVTSENKGEIQKKTADDVINVFIPTTPNPTSGFLLFVPKQDLILLDMRPDAAMKLIVSGGVIDKPVNDDILESTLSTSKIID